MRSAMYVIKVGNQYVGRDGHLTDRQPEAMRLETSETTPRLVKLRPKLYVATDQATPQTSSSAS